MLEGFTLQPVYLGLSPFPVANEGLGWDSLEMLKVPAVTILVVMFYGLGSNGINRHFLPTIWENIFGTFSNNQTSKSKFDCLLCTMGFITIFYPPFGRMFFFTCSNHLWICFLGDSLLFYHGIHHRPIIFFGSLEQCWKPWLVVGYRGSKTTQLSGDYFISQYKDPVINQPVFHGMSTRSLNVAHLFLLHRIPFARPRWSWEAFALSWERSRCTFAQNNGEAERGKSPMGLHEKTKGTRFFSRKLREKKGQHVSIPLKKWLMIMN